MRQLILLFIIFNIRLSYSQQLTAYQIAERAQEAVKVKGV